MDHERPEAPAYQPPAGQAIPAINGKNTRRVIALWLLIGPTALIIGSLLLYAIVNFILASTMPATPPEGEAFGSQSPIQTILNVILFLVGAVSVMTWLPGIIAGIVLLTTEKKS